jgi:hypothetical protein
MGLFAFFKKRSSDNESEPGVVPVEQYAAPKPVSPKPVVRPKPVIKPVEDPLGFLDNPELEIEEDGFDPYNSGAFEKDAGWRKVD